MAAGSRGGGVLPGGNLWLVGDEVIVQVPSDEPGRGRLLGDDADDILAIQVAGLA